jgi:hypothetical protein
MTATSIALLTVPLLWATGTGMILLLGWRQDGKVEKIDMWMAVAFGLLFWPMLAWEWMQSKK